MKLPWNKKYLEISFHVIVTAGILVILGMLLFRLSEAKNVIMQTAGRILAVFSPLLWAIFFSMLLEPITAFYQRQYESRLSYAQKNRIKNRKAGTAAAYLSFLLLLAVGGGWAVKSLGTADLEVLVEQLTGFVQKMGDLLVLLNIKLAQWGILQNVEGLLSAWTENATLWVQVKLTTAAAQLPQIGSGLLDVLVGLTAAFYFLMEKAGIRRFFGDATRVLLGERTASRLSGLLGEINAVVMGYLGGQLTDAAIMAGLFSVAFVAVGLPYGVVLGLVSGFSNLIPYFGAVMAFILAVFAGLLSGEPVRALYASILILILQQMDSVFIVPKVVGKKVELHPVLVLLSLAVFGRLFGFWGLFVAVPLGALTKTFFLWLIERGRRRNHISAGDRSE